VFGERSAWQPLAEPPPDRDLDRIAELRAVAEQQRAARVRAEATKQQAETLVLRQEAETPEEKRGGVFFAALIGYLVSCFAAATVLVVAMSGAHGGQMVIFLVLFPFLPLFLVVLSPLALVLWAVGFAICSVVIFKWLDAKES
jgi:ABC-type transport system involved in cytochrome bd biosynthesis fused ATPase/permease subunit